MLSIMKMFEGATFAPPAISPTAERDAYVKQRKATLRQMKGKPKQDTAQINQELNMIEKTKNDLGWGKTKF